jgi:lysophospholipase L1-like esterase
MNNFVKSLRGLIGCTLLVVTSLRAATLPSQLDTVQDCAPDDGRSFRILFIGDSITLHGFNDWTIQHLGWSHLSGMAASSRQSDYANLLSKKISGFRGLPTVVCYHTAGGNGAVAQRLQALDRVISTEPNLVVIQLGEHEDPAQGAQRLYEDYKKLIQAVRAMRSKPSVIAVGPWSLSVQDNAGRYKGWIGVVDQTMQAVAAQERVPYASVADIAGIRAAHGTGISEGVRWHPNDYGQSLYAERLFTLYEHMDP